MKIGPFLPPQPPTPPQPATPHSTPYGTPSHPTPAISEQNSLVNSVVPTPQRQTPEPSSHSSMQPTPEPEEVPPSQPSASEMARRTLEEQIRRRRELLLSEKKDLSNGGEKTEGPK